MIGMRKQIYRLADDDFILFLQKLEITRLE